MALAMATLHYSWIIVSARLKRVIYRWLAFYIFQHYLAM